MLLFLQNTIPYCLHKSIKRFFFKHLEKYMEGFSFFFISGHFVTLPIKKSYMLHFSNIDHKWNFGKTRKISEVNNFFPKVHIYPYVK